MNLTRRYQLLTPYSYCRTSQCTWRDNGVDDPEAQAVVHVRVTGHECRVVTTREVILTLPKLQEVSS